MNKSIDSVSRINCSGCSACSNICPAHAIAMTADAEGFCYPEVDTGRCTDCGLCRSVCAACTEYSSGGSAEPLCYAMMAESAIREDSSSGGMFGQMAELVLEQGGAVVGCAFSEQLTAVHVLVTDPAQLPALRHSKYTQSDMTDIYRRTKEFLVQHPDKQLLFTGCPCHVAGLRLFLKKDYPNLITADLICHGIASPGVFSRYLAELSDRQGSPVKKFTFRDKKIYGWRTCVSAEFENGSTYHRSDGEAHLWNDGDPYLKAYQKNMMLRPSCTRCRFAAIPRQGDITIGDFWGIANTDKYMNDGHGTSLVLVSSEKGEKMLENVFDKCKKIRRMPLSAALEKQPHLHRPAAPHPRRDDFFRLLRHHTVEDAEEMLLSGQYDIGLIGAWYFPNYGTTLTYYALHTVLEELGYTVLMIDKPEIKSPDIERRDNYARSFAKKQGYHVSEVYNIRNTSQLNDLCRIFMLGSDQMWTWTRCEKFGNYYFLDFARDDKKKIVYAGSFGREDFFAPESGRAACAFHAARLDAVSVREDIGVEICKKRFGIEAEFVLDPIFLCDFKKYYALAESCQCRKPEKPYVMSYILDPTEGRRNAILKAAQTLGGLDTVNALNAVPWMHKENAEKLGMPNILENAGLEEILFYYSHADFVVTDSFHGTCLAILFRKPFVTIANHKRGLCRFHSLMGMLGLMDRLVYQPSEIAKADDAFFHPEIDYDRVYAIIAAERERSMAWLKAALEKEKAAQPSAYDMLCDELSALRREVAELRSDAAEK